MTGFEELLEKIKQDKCGTDLDLSNKEINSEQAERLATVLAHNTSIETLNLRGNDLGWKGGCAIAKALEVNKTITSLNLSYTNLGEKEGINPFSFSDCPAGFAIAKMIEHNKTLKKIDLSSNFLFQSDLSIGMALGHNNTLTELVLKSCSLADGGISYGLQMNPSVTSIDLSENYKSLNSQIPIIAKLISQNIEIQSIRQEILTLLPEAPVSYETLELENIEVEFDKNHAENILARIKMLSDNGCPKVKVQVLQHELTLAACGWDGYKSLDERIKELKDIVLLQDFSDDISSRMVLETSFQTLYLRDKALARLAPIYITQGIAYGRMGKPKEAVECFILAFTASLHGEETEFKNDFLCQSVSLLFDNVIFDNVKSRDNIRILLQELQQEHPDRLQALKLGYREHCKKTFDIYYQMDMSLFPAEDGVSSSSSASAFSLHGLDLSKKRKAPSSSSSPSFSSSSSSSSSYSSAKDPSPVNTRLENSEGEPATKKAKIEP